MENEVFSCKKCGYCCEGAGGIVVSPSDLLRICEHLELSSECFTEKYGIMHNNKLKIRTGDDGYCIFFVMGQGCSVHIAKPNICRAWPYFRGNIVDSESLAMAKDFCAGINPAVSHEVFAAEGRKYLRENELVAKSSVFEANALIG